MQPLLAATREASRSDASKSRPPRPSSAAVAIGHLRHAAVAILYFARLLLYAISMA